ncbi:MAG TPA: hypothetical protein VMY88_09850 [Acidimicrobiales bacterium]|nr:hypothetical protein [Acidimicrobiales bacterium]
MKRRGTVGVACAVGLVLLTQVLLPKTTPVGVIFLGLLSGCSTSLLAAGLVLVHRAARVVNFAQAALGSGAAYLCFVTAGLLDWPLFVAIPLGVGFGALTGLVVDAAFVQRFFTAPRLVLTVLTIVLGRLLTEVPRLLDRIPVLGAASRNFEGRQALEAGTVELPWADKAFHLAPLRFGTGAILAVVLCAAGLAALALFLRTSRLGTAVRGAAVNAERAQSLGINVRSLSSIVWAIAGALAGLALIADGVASSFAVRDFPPQMLLAPLAAAVLARLASIPAAVAAAFAIGIAEQAILWSFPRAAFLDAVFLVVIAGGLLSQRVKAARSETGPASSWEATREIRPVPAELAGVPGVRRSRRALVGVALLIVFLFPFVTSDAQVNLAALIFIQAIVALSLVVLTGWAGQVSLGQFGLVAVAAVLGGHLTADRGISFWIALPLIIAITAGLAAGLGLPALRVPGPFLAVVTLAFAVAVQSAIFTGNVFEGVIPDRINRPRFFFWSFASERGYYFLCLALLVVAAIVVSRLRKARPGRVLIALRENPSGVQSFGVSLLRTRLVAFAVSGGLCGLAGILFAHHQRAIDAASYSAGVSIEMFVMAMIGGISSVTGALLGAAYVGTANFLISDAVFQNVATSGGLLVLLFVAPGGLAAVVTSARDAVLRIVATRQGIAAPSLFADRALEAMEARRAPLAEPLPNRGLEAIPASRRYRRGSRLHGPRPVAEVAR